MRKAKMTAGCLVCLCLGALSVQAVHPLEALTGSRTKVVWVRDVGDGRDVFGRGNRLQLMLLDTRENGGRERPVLPGPRACAKPIFTPDGRRIVFSDRPGNVFYAVNTDGTGLRKVGDGFALATWADPNSGRTWIYYQQRRAGKKPENNPVRRLPLDGKGPDELVWDRTPISEDNFQISRDGTLASGLFPWPSGGVAELPNRGWRQYARGCWTSLAPDDSGLFWIFDGPHRNVTMTNLEGRSWLVCIGDAPGIDGFEVYHPRWSNDPRLLTVTGPYLGRGGEPGGNRIGGGGTAVEIHVGRFSESFTEVEAWVRITTGQQADFLPDVWVEGGERQNVPRAVAGNELPETISEAELRNFARWPGTAEGLVFLWENAAARNEVPGADGQPARVCRLREVRKAVYGPNQEMITGGGAFAAEDADDALLQACRSSNALTVEATIATDHLDQHGPARIVSFSSSTGSRNFTLGQQGDQLVFRLRTPRTGDNGTNPEVQLGKITPGQPVHVLVSYAPGRLACYLDGVPVSFAAQRIQGDFSNWSAQHLVFGDEWTADRGWQGRIEGVAIWARPMGPEEAARRFALNQARIGNRDPIPRLIVDARLDAVSATPSPASIAPYRRCLAEYSYTVVKVIEGECTAPRIAVAHWVILDGKVLPGQAEIGKTVRLALEPFDRHPQLKGERLATDLDEFDLPTYYDLER